MRSWFLRSRPTNRPPSFRPTLEGLEERSLLDASGFIVTNLLSDLPGVAEHRNIHLINPWGFAETPQGQFQVAANGSGDTLHINAKGKVISTTILQPPLGSQPGTTTTPNGTFLNTTKDFVISDDGKSAPAKFIFSTEDGTLVAFSPQVDKKEGILVAQSSDGAVFKLLAEASNANGNFLFATDFHNNKIAVFDKNFDPVTLAPGAFTDPNEPSGYAPFGIKLINLNGQNVLFVSYAKQDAAGHDDVAGAGNGFIDEFDTMGNYIGRFATGSAVGGTAPLNSPIGMTIAPAGFGPHGEFGGALLVGNFGDSHVSAFNLQTGQFLGQLSDAQGNPLTLNGGVGGAGTKGLWGIAFGNGKGGTDKNALYFAAGINAENDGLFGKVTLSKGDHDHDGDSRVSPAAAVMAQSSGMMQPPSMMQPTSMMQPPSMMQFSNGMVQSISAAQVESRIDAFFASVDSMLLTLESQILMQMPKLDGAIQVFNMMVDNLESFIAGHSIDDLAGKV